MWHAGDEWRAVVEHIGIISRTVLDRLLKRLVLLPALYPIFFIFECPTPSSVFEFHAQLPFVFSKIKISFSSLESELPRTVPSSFEKEIVLFALSCSL